MKKKAKTLSNKMGKPPYHDAQPPRMSRSVPKGEGGDTFRIPNGAKYGLGEGVAPTRMDRKVPAGKTGSVYRVPQNGPARSSRKDTGANSHMGKGYGVNGVSVSNVGKSVANHGGSFGGGTGVAGDTGRYGGS